MPCDLILLLYVKGYFILALQTECFMVFIFFILNIIQSTSHMCGAMASIGSKSLNTVCKQTMEMAKYVKWTNV